jgi:excisionase family DNA binding protein
MEHESPAKLANSIHDVCSRTGLGRTTVYRLLSDGELKSFLVGTRRLVSEASLVAFLAEREKAAT